MKVMELDTSGMNEVITVLEDLHVEAKKGLIKALYICVDYDNNNNEEIMTGRWDTRKTVGSLFRLMLLANETD